MKTFVQFLESKKIIKTNEMFAYCDKCGYDSGDEKDNDVLAAKVKKDGGQLGDKCICPKCGMEGTLGVD